MFVDGRPSWRIDSDMPADLHYALFVRDAVGLGEGNTGGRLPGKLRSHVAAPDLRKAVSETAREAASEQWRRWWDLLVETPPLGIDEMRARVRSAPAAGDPRINRMIELAGGMPELVAIVERCAGERARWETHRKPLVPEYRWRRFHGVHELGLELQRRTDAAGKSPVQVRIDFLMTSGTGVAITSHHRAIVWGDALADHEIREELCAALA